MKELATSRKDVFLLPLTKLREDKQNPREDYSNVPDLAVSMFGMGQLTPHQRNEDPVENLVVGYSGLVKWEIKP
ncbi:MAG: hypothetical protein IMZ58_08210 [Thermoplasmata archaeon]|nr:hypothetical protein [Thermoplasmata archaeon]